jgi:hypothetical protein
MTKRHDTLRSETLEIGRDKTQVRLDWVACLLCGGEGCEACNRSGMLPTSGSVRRLRDAWASQVRTYEQIIGFLNAATLTLSELRSHGELYEEHLWSVIGGADMEHVWLSLDARSDPRGRRPTRPVIGLEGTFLNGEALEAWRRRLATQQGWTSPVIDGDEDPGNYRRKHRSETPRMGEEGVIAWGSRYGREWRRKDVHRLVRSATRHLRWVVGNYEPELAEAREKVAHWDNLLEVFKEARSKRKLVTRIRAELEPSVANAMEVAVAQAERTVVSASRLCHCGKSGYHQLEDGTWLCKRHAHAAGLLERPKADEPEPVAGEGEVDDTPAEEPGVRLPEGVDVRNLSPARRRALGL